MRRRELDDRRIEGMLLIVLQAAGVLRCQALKGALGHLTEAPWPEDAKR